MNKSKSSQLQDRELQRISTESNKKNETTEKKCSLFSSKTLCESYLKNLQKRMASDDIVPGISTGFSRLNDITQGLQPSDLIVIASPPSGGKTAFALNIAVSAALESNSKIGFFSFGMSQEKIMERLLSTLSMVDAVKLKSGTKLTKKDHSSLEYAQKVLSDLQFYIDDDFPLTIEDIASRARRLKAEKNIGIIFIDYIQLLQHYTNAAIRTITQNLKVLAKELEIPIVAITQMDHDVLKRTNNYPTLAGLPGNGAINEDADLIMFIHQQESPLCEDLYPAEVIIAKQRTGPTGIVSLTYNQKYLRFEYGDREETFFIKKIEPFPVEEFGPDSEQAKQIFK